MKKVIKSILMLLLVVTMVDCSKVPAGNVGIKFYMLGGSKGVDSEELGPGRYWIGMNEELYLFPTFTQNYVWTSSVDEGSENDESFNFQDSQGLELNADVGITYHLNPNKISSIFEKYKRGIDEITDVFLRNMVRDALVTESSKYKVEYIYGKGRSAVLDSVQLAVKKEVRNIGIEIDKIYWIGRIKLPATVMKAVNAKIQATQKAQQSENELRQAQAEAKKIVAEAQGAKQSMILRAEGEAAAIKLKTKTITKMLIEYEKAMRWDGKLPNVTGGVIPMMNIK